MIKRYFLLRCFPEPGSGMPLLSNGSRNPVVIRELGGWPLGISEGMLEMAIQDPLERAVVMTQGIIAEYVKAADWTDWYIKRAWRVKKKNNWFVRGHQLRIPNAWNTTLYGISRTGEMTSRLRTVGYIRRS
jgi:hypothetical protein